MTEKCAKSGCEKEAVKKLRFTDLFLRVDTDYPVALCEGHTKEVQKFEDTDVVGVKEWLKAAP